MINIFRATVYIIYVLSIDFWDTVYDQNSMTNIFRSSVYIIDRLIIDFGTLSMIKTVCLIFLYCLIIL